MGVGVESTEWVHLVGEERVLWAGTPSIYPATPVIAFGFAVSVLGVWLFREVSLPVVPEWLLLLLLPIGVLVGAWAYLKRWSTRYVFTTKAVYAKTGILSRTVTRVGFDRVQNTAFDQSSVERMLSYGDIAVYTAGTGGMDVSLRDVPDPKRVNGLVTTQLSETAAESRGESHPAD
jgi:membrane protein YdbS with pleckstrin-like domain